MSIEDVEATDDWTATREGPTVVWAGGSVPSGETASFAFTARLASAGGVITFQGEEVYVGFSIGAPRRAGEGHVQRKRACMTHVPAR